MSSPSEEMAKELLCNVNGCDHFGDKLAISSKNEDAYTISPNHRPQRHHFWFVAQRNSEI